MTGTTESRWWRRCVGAAVAAVLALTLAACGDPSDDAGNAGDAGSGGQAGEPQQGGTLTVIAGGPVNSWDPALNPHTIPGLTADRLNAIYGVLVYTDAEGNVQPGMAESLTSEDDVTWTLTLRPDLQFTDGTPFDAEAVKYNWDRIADPDGGAVSQEFAATFTTEVVDPVTLVASLQQPDPSFDLRVAELLQFIASPQSLEAQGDNYTEPVGAGPFMLESWEQGVQETVVRNPDYWDPERPHLDEIVFKFVADPAQRVATVVQGGAHYMNGYPFQFADEAENPDVGTFEVEAGGLRHFIFNTRQAPFDDPRARRAVALAFDKTELVQTLTQDQSEEGAGTLFPDSSPYHDESLALPEQNLEEAQALVDELAAEGKPMEFTIVAAGVPELDRASQLLQLSLNELDGVTANVETIAIADWRARVNQGNYNITFYPGIYDLNGAEVSMPQLLSSTGGENIAQYSSPEMDAALDEAQAADGEAKVEAFKQVQEIYLQDIPIVVFGIDARTFFHRAEMGGFTPAGRGYLLMKELYLTE